MYAREVTNREVCDDEGVSLWENVRSAGVLDALAAPLTTPLLKGATGMADTQRTTQTRRRKNPYKKATGLNGRQDTIHRLRAERALGRPLPPGVQVHHADGSKDHDAPLVICQDAAYHRLLHMRMRIRAAGGDPDTERICPACKNLTPLDSMVGRGNHRCKRCHRERRAAHLKAKQDSGDWIFCACGCGRQLREFSKYGERRLSLKGHSNRLRAKA